MRSPADPFHEQPVTSYPQIRRFLPQGDRGGRRWTRRRAAQCSTPDRALRTWLAERHTTRLPDTDVPMQCGRSWEPHMHDRDDGTVNRAAYVSSMTTTGLRHYSLTLDCPEPIAGPEFPAQVYAPDKYLDPRARSVHESGRRSRH